MTENDIKKAAVEAENSRDGFVVKKDTAVILSSAISDKVKGKLLDTDIASSKTEVMNAIQMNIMDTKLCGGCTGICNSYQATMMRSRPRGSMHAKVMVINKMPSGYEAAVGTSVSDEKGMLITTILNKMGIPLEEIYYTDLVKCSNPSVSTDDIKKCISEYLQNEIRAVKPKLIIANGLSVIRILSSFNLILGLTDGLEYGKIYNGKIDGFDSNIVGIYELEKVLMKDGDELSKCKSVLWTQIQSALASIGITPKLDAFSLFTPVNKTM